MLLGVASLVVYMVQTLLLGELICWLGLFNPGLNVVFMSLLPGEDCFH
jgi:hypothetical protein